MTNVPIASGHKNLLAAGDTSAFDASVSSRATSSRNVSSTNSSTDSSSSVSVISSGSFPSSCNSTVLHNFTAVPASTVVTGRSIAHPSSDSTYAGSNKVNSINADRNVIDSNAPRVLQQQSNSFSSNGLDEMSQFEWGSVFLAKRQRPIDDVELERELTVKLRKLDTTCRTDFGSYSVFTPPNKTYGWNMNGNGDVVGNGIAPSVANASSGTDLRADWGVDLRSNFSGGTDLSGRNSNCGGNPNGDTNVRDYGDDTGMSRSNGSMMMDSDNPMSDSVCRGLRRPGGSHVLNITPQRIMGSPLENDDDGFPDPVMTAEDEDAEQSPTRMEPYHDRAIVRYRPPEEILKLENSVPPALQMKYDMRTIDHNQDQFWHLRNGCPMRDILENATNGVNNAFIHGTNANQNESTLVLEDRNYSPSSYRRNSSNSAAGGSCLGDQEDVDMN